jgi:hypothetical protein
MPKPGVYRYHLGTISLTWSFRPRCTNFVAARAYDQAKRGVGEAAFKVVQELIKPEKIPFAFDIILGRTNEIDPPSLE